jgi:hypothetical protein
LAGETWTSVPEIGSRLSRCNTLRRSSLRWTAPQPAHLRIDH